MNKAIVNTISEYFAGQPIEKAWIFGSYARSEENQESDIDILVNFLPGSKITLFQYVHMLNELQSLTGKRIDLVEEGQLKPFAVKKAGSEKVLIYQRNAKG
jgi:hypothetical protein